jgi:Polyphosphate kinase 2 (PPK2)
LIERTISASHGRHVHAPPFWQRVAALAGMELKAMDSKTIPGKQLSEALNDELLETIDEELELEFDDQRLDSVLGSLAPAGAKETLDRRTYFRELLRLQRELIKLQDWVVHQKLKLVVLFEGRDAAGKGGVIKRITQRLNPRVCKVVALSAPTERERTQWYFQRSAGGRRNRVVRPQLVQPRRRRTCHGFLHRGRLRGVLPHCAGIRADAGPVRHHSAEILVLDHRSGAELALPDAHP